MELAKLQRYLEHVYQIDAQHNVDDFLVTDALLARQLDASANPRDISEKLLVRQGDDGMELSVFIDRLIVDSLTRHDPTEKLHQDNVVPFWIALEGVSHFLYLVWNARHGRNVTLLEMELQAEVDQFVGAWFFLKDQGHDAQTPALLNGLFGNPCFDPQLNSDERQMYVRANRYAEKYCASLSEQFKNDIHSDNLLNELRRFYRLTHQYKLRRIQAIPNN